MELGVRPHSSTRLEMSSTDPTSHPLRPLHPPEQDNMPDFITVRVPTGGDKHNIGRHLADTVRTAECGDGLGLLTQHTSQRLTKTSS